MYVTEVVEDGLNGFMCFPFAVFGIVGSVFSIRQLGFRFGHIIALGISIFLFVWAVKKIYNYCRGMPMWVAIPLIVVVFFLVYRDLEGMRIVVASGAAYLALIFFVFNCDTFELY